MGSLAFKGESGISVFESESVDPTLSEEEVLKSFREGSQTIVRSKVEIEEKGLRVETIEGAEFLPQHLRDSHAEIRPGPGMTRRQFKQPLKELE